MNKWLISLACAFGVAACAGSPPGGTGSSSGASRHYPEAGGTASGSVSGVGSASGAASGSVTPSGEAPSGVSSSGTSNQPMSDRGPSASDGATPVVPDATAGDAMQSSGGTDDAAPVESAGAAKPCPPGLMRQGADKCVPIPSTPTPEAGGAARSGG
ncbi:MAG TPA: hypothetical protein VEC06_06970 [Paucimonas sp.]|nr:hypothetical protein [Paucimonas sp.]